MAKPKTKITPEEQLKLYEAIRRERMKEDGYYDGRFRRRVEKDKKKEKSRTHCREKVRWEE